MLLRDVGQRDQANLAFVSQLSQSFHRRLKRDNGVRDMQLINVDAVEAQSFEASLNRLAKVLGSSIVGPLIRAGAVPASLGGNYQASRVRKQRLGNQFLAYIWTVGVRGIDEIDMKLDGTAKHRQRPITISGRSPDSFAGKAHRPVAETMHVDFPAQRNITSRFCREFFLVHDCPPKFFSPSFLATCSDTAPFLAKPLWVGVSAVEPVARLIKLELPRFRSLCCFFKKRRNLGRIDRLKTAGSLKSLLKNRERVAACDNNASGKIHRVVKALHGGSCLALENNVVTHGLHAEHADFILKQDR